MGTANDDPDAVAYIALHEAGHAVAAVVLGFELRRIVVKGPESSAPLKMIWGVVGEVDSSASDVGPAEPDADVKHRSAVVAMAGRAARRLKHPGGTHEGGYLEEDDRRRASALVGDGAALEAVTQEADELIQSCRSSVEAIVDELLARPLPAVLQGLDARRIIQSACQRGRPTSGCS